MGGHIQRTKPTRNFPSGGWEARWQVVDQGRRRYRAKTFSTKAEAQRHLAAAVTDLHRGDWLDPALGKTPVRVVADRWLATGPGHREQTRRGYAALVRNHVLPRLGDLPIGSLSRADIRVFVADLGAAGAAAGTVRNVVHNALKPILDLAVEDGMLKSNPAQRVKLPSSNHAEMLFLTAPEVEELAEAMAAPFHVLIRFAAYTGLRAGEIGALQVGDLDLMRGRATVRRSVTSLAGQGLVYGPTKTHKARTVSIPRFVIDPLMALVAPYADDSDALVFRSASGGPLRHGNFYRRQFKPAVVAAFPERLHGLRFHDLRHTCASLMINPPVSANPKLVQERLGHSSIQTTFDRYGHLFQAADEELTSRLDALGTSLAASNGRRSRLAI